MSLESAKLFHLKIKGDSQLQEALLEEAYKTGEEPLWRSLAKEHGFDVTDGDVSGYLNGIGGDEYELTEFELGLVAAASSSTCGDDGA